MTISRLIPILSATPSTPMTIPVIGGGLAGVLAALELADAGYKVILIERFPEILLGTSNATLQRLHIGTHYRDLATSILCLHSTIHLLRKYPGFIVGQDLPQSHPYRKSLFVHAKASEQSLENTIELFEALKAEYKRLIAEDPLNNVLGDPEDFFKQLTEEQCTNLSDRINLDLVNGIFEICESTLDLPKLKAFLTEKVKNHPKIEFLPNTQVCKIEHQGSPYRYAVTLEATDEKSAIATRQIFCNTYVNSAWENIHPLNQAIVPLSDSKRRYINKTGESKRANWKEEAICRTHRTKVSIVIALPHDYEHKELSAETLFVGYGSFCAMNITGQRTADGRIVAILAYEPETNVEQTIEDEISSQSKRWLQGEATQGEKERFSRKIIEGASEYFLGIEGAEVLDVNFGVVTVEAPLTAESAGRCNLSDKTSAHHVRTNKGISSIAPGVVNNPAMKLIAASQNASEVKGLVDSQCVADNAKYTMLAQLKKNKEFQGMFKKDVKEDHKDSSKAKLPDLRAKAVGESDKQFAARLGRQRVRTKAA